jgi:hypothetical protein
MQVKYRLIRTTVTANTGLLREIKDSRKKRKKKINLMTIKINMIMKIEETNNKKMEMKKIVQVEVVVVVVVVVTTPPPPRFVAKAEGKEEI